MNTPDPSHTADREVGPLGSAASEPPDDADGMAGPVNPPPETEPDAHGDRED